MQGENKALYVSLFGFKEKKKVLHFRDVDFFLAKVWRANTITFSDCKLLLLLYILNLTLLSMYITFFLFVNFEDRCFFLFVFFHYTSHYTEQRAESNLSMYLTGATQLQSEGLTLCNKAETVDDRTVLNDPCYQPDACSKRWPMRSRSFHLPSPSMSLVKPFLCPRCFCMKLFLIRDMSLVCNFFFYFYFCK